MAYRGHSSAVTSNVPRNALLTNVSRPAGIAPRYHELLRVEQRPVARLVLVELPPHVLQLLQAALESLPDLVHGSRRSARAVLRARHEGEMQGDETEGEAQKRKREYGARRERARHDGEQQRRQQRCESAAEREATRPRG